MTVGLSRIFRLGLLGLLLATAPFMITGCGKKGQHATAPVTGKVTLDGEPLKFGDVVFFPSGDFPTAQGKIGADGTYVMGTYDTTDGVVPGKHKVAVTARVAAGATLPEEAVKGAAGTVSAIPERYSDPARSGLEFEVKSGKNTIDIALTTLDRRTGKK